MKFNYPTLLIALIVMLVISAFTLFKEIETETDSSVISQVNLTNPVLSLPPSAKTTKPAIDFSIRQTDINLCNESENEKLTSKLSKLKLLLTENINNLNKTLNDNEYNITEKKNIIESFGLSIETYRKTTSWHAGLDYTDLRTTDSKPVSLQGDNFFEFFQYWEAKDYESILTFIKTKNLTSATVVGGESIISSLMKHDNKINSDTINQLIIAGLEPNFADLVTATKLGMPLQVIETLVLNFEGPINKIWYENYHKNTLAMVAAENLDVVLFNYWINLGVKLTTGSSDYNVLDVITKPENVNELESAIDIFRTAIQLDIKPYKQESLKLLQDWLPVDIRDQFPELFSHRLLKNWKAYLHADMSEKDFQKLNRFYKLIQSTKTTIKEIETAIIFCGNKENNNKLHENESSFATHSNSGYEQQKPVTLEEQKAIQDKITVSKRLQSLIADNDWEGYLLALKDYPLDERDTLAGLHNMAMLQLVTANAPSAIIEELILEGASLNLATLHAFISSNNTDLAAALIPYYFDYEAIFGNKANLVDFAKGMKASPEMVTFLNEF